MPRVVIQHGIRLQRTIGGWAGSIHGRSIVIRPLPGKHSWRWRATLQGKPLPGWLGLNMRDLVRAVKADLDPEADL